jgi:hypothetical protein
MTDQWAEERAEFIEAIIPPILHANPNITEVQLVAILGAVVTGLDEVWRDTLRQFASQLAADDRDPVTRPGLRVAARALTVFAEGS